MSTSEERMLILNMLKEGKINSEEAAKLLEALDKGNEKTKDTNGYQQNSTSFQEEAARMKERMHEWKKEFKSTYKSSKHEMKGKIHDLKKEFTDSFNQKDFDKAVEEFANKAEKLGKNVATTTFSIADKLVDFVGSFIETNAFNIFGSYKSMEKTFEAKAYEGMDLKVKGTNGYIFIKKHDKEDIAIKTTVKSPTNNADELVSFNSSEKELVMDINKTGNISVSHEIFLPKIKFGNINIETINGKIYVEDSVCEKFEGITRNSHIDLMGVNSEEIAVKTKNAKIQLSYCIGKHIEINTNNSLIDVKHIKADKLKALTMNGRIVIEDVQSFDIDGDTVMDLKTSNSGIKVNMNDMDDRAYKVKAQTTHGGINLLIPDMIYSNIDKGNGSSNVVEANSKNYDEGGRKVNIKAETINGYIEIVK